MHKPKRIFIISALTLNPIKMFLNQTRKLAKGFIRLGHDVYFFNYPNALFQISPIKSKTFATRFCKSRTDELLASQIKNYQPDVIYMTFPRVADAETIIRCRKAAPGAVFIGSDGDLWPKLRKRDKIQTAKKLDIVTATNDGQFLQEYRNAGVPLCVFMPNFCDPDIDYRYEVGPEWKTDILWTGKAKHGVGSGETLREEIVTKLTQQKNCKLYGCCGQPRIGGINYLYAISGARIGVNVNAMNSVRLYHSDRLIHYLSCGTFVLAKRVPDTDLLYKDGEHLKYFDSADEFFELADWYLKHEQDRAKIAKAGREKAYSEFNCIKIAGYMLELIETGAYNAPWVDIL